MSKLSLIPRVPTAPLFGLKCKVQILSAKDLSGLLGT